MIIKLNHIARWVVGYVVVTKREKNYASIKFNITGVVLVWSSQKPAATINIKSFRDFGTYTLLECLYVWAARRYNGEDVVSWASHIVLGQINYCFNFQLMRLTVMLFEQTNGRRWALNDKSIIGHH